MTRLTAKITTLVVAIAGVLVIGARFGSRAESKPGHAAVTIDTSETTEAKIGARRQPLIAHFGSLLLGAFSVSGGHPD
jgi:hypothetical protein